MSMLGLLVRVAGSRPIVQEGANVERIPHYPACADESVERYQAQDLRLHDVHPLVEPILRSNNVRLADPTPENSR
jgi:hypothetical protein